MGDEDKWEKAAREYSQSGRRWADGEGCDYAGGSWADGYQHGCFAGFKAGVRAAMAASRGVDLPPDAFADENVMVSGTTARSNRSTRALVTACASRSAVSLSRMMVRVERLERALRSGIELVVVEYCSHQDPCGAHNERCHARELYAALDEPNGTPQKG
jgi:hypothetical protein